MVGRRARRIPFRVDKGLQNQCRRNLVHHFAVLLAVLTGLIKYLVRLSRRHALVPKVNRQAGQLSQLGGKGLRLERARAFLS